MGAAIAIISITIMFMIVIFGVKYNNSNEQKKVQDFNKKIELDVDKFNETMSKIIDSDSFKITFEKSELQVVEFDINLIMPEQEDYSNLDAIDEKHSTYLFKFSYFLIKENFQFPIFKFGNNEALVAFLDNYDKERVHIYHIWELQSYLEQQDFNWVFNSIINSQTY